LWRIGDVVRINQAAKVPRLKLSLKAQPKAQPKATSKVSDEVFLGLGWGSHKEVGKFCGE
jgi:hypothetical protein